MNTYFYINARSDGIAKDRFKRKFNHVCMSVIGSNTYTTWYILKHHGTVTNNRRSLFNFTKLMGKNHVLTIKIQFETFKQFDTAHLTFHYDLL